jgi:lipopolysaccharide export system permease protein
VQANGKLLGVTRYQYDEQQRLVSASFAETALYTNNGSQEENVIETRFPESREEPITTEKFSSRPWQTELSPNLLTILVQDTDSLAITKLYDYAQYLEKQNLDNGKYLLAYWGKVLQPLVIISLVLVAISFIFGPLREVTMGYRIFTGVVVGITFQLTQKLLGPASLLYGISPLFAVLLPIMFCFGLGLFLLARTR